MPLQKGTEKYNLMIQRMSLSRKGKKRQPFSEEHKRRISEARKRKFASGELIHPRGMLGKKHTEEEKQQISNTLKTNPESRAYRTPKFYKKLSESLISKGGDDFITNIQPLCHSSVSYTHLTLPTNREV